METLNKLQQILQIEAEISNLGSRKERLGREYVKENFKFSKGDKIVVEMINGKQIKGVIISIHFDSHSKIKGLVKFAIFPLNNKGEKIPNRSGVWFGDEPIKEIRFFKI